MEEAGCIRVKGKKTKKRSRNLAAWASGGGLGDALKYFHDRPIFEAGKEKREWKSEDRGRKRAAGVLFRHVSSVFCLEAALRRRPENARRYAR